MTELYKPKYPCFGQPGQPFGYKFTFEGVVGDAHMTEKEWACIKDLAQGKDYLEIGSYMGYSTSAAKAGNAKSIVCIDQQIRELPAKIATRTIMMDSLEAHTQLKDQFDLILIDGNHTAKYVAADITHYYPMLRKGGLIMFHDYGVNGTYLGVWGVTETVDAYFAPNQYIKTVDSLIIFQKRL